MSGAILISDDLVNINIIIIHIIITITNIIVILIISISVIDHRPPHHHGRHFHLLNFLVSIMGPAINQRANFFLSFIFYGCHHQGKIVHQVEVVAFVLVMTPFATNPFIYVVSDPNYRRSVHRVQF